MKKSQGEMIMRKILLAIMVGCLAIPFALTAQNGNVNLPQDKGASTVDVSSYPADQQKGYKVFLDKCSKCHTIARPINTTMTKEEWSRYVKRMMHKPNSGISDAQGKAIYEFLAYDQERRKDKNPNAFFKALSDEEIEKLKSSN
jgi:mono/diheme cytochrome c family protein